MAAERAVELRTAGAVLLGVSRAGIKCIAAAPVLAFLDVLAWPLET